DATPVAIQMLRVLPSSSPAGAHHRVHEPLDDLRRAGNVCPPDADGLPVLVAIGAEARALVLPAVLRDTLGRAAAGLHAEHLDRDRRRVRGPDLVLETLAAAGGAGRAG